MRLKSLSASRRHRRVDRPPPRRIANCNRHLRDDDGRREAPAHVMVVARMMLASDLPPAISQAAAAGPTLQSSYGKKGLSARPPKLQCIQCLETDELVGDR